MDGAGDEFLAGAALAGDERGGVAGGKLAEPAAPAGAEAAPAAAAALIGNRPRNPAPLIMVVSLLLALTL